MKKPLRLKEGGSTERRKQSGRRVRGMWRVSRHLQVSLYVSAQQLSSLLGKSPAVDMGHDM